MADKNNQDDETLARMQQAVADLLQKFSSLTTIMKGSGDAAKNIEDFIKSAGGAADVLVKAQEAISAKTKELAGVNKDVLDHLVAAKEINEQNKTLKDADLMLSREAKAIQEDMSYGLREQADLLDSLNKKQDEINRSSKDWFTQWKENAQERRRLKALEDEDYAKRQGNIAGMDKTTGIGEGISRGVGALTAEIPFGGLLGLMFYGKQKEWEYSAEAQKIGQIFDKGQGDAQKAMGAIASTVRRYSAEAQEWIKGDLASISQSLAGVGVSAKEAFGTFNTDLMQKQGLHAENMAMAFEKLDKYLEMGSGASAKFAAELSQNFGTSMKEGFDSLKRMSDALQGTVAQKQMFIQQVMAASTALRYQKIDIEDVAKAQLAYSKSLEAVGMSRAQAQATAAAGTSGATGAIAGLDIGLSAVIGERMGIKGGNGEAASGLDAWYAMKSQMGRSGNLDVQGVAKQLAALAGEGGRSQSEQVYFLSKMATGGNVQAAEALLKMGNAGSLSEKNAAVDQYNKAMETEGQKIDLTNRVLESMKNDIAQIGAGLLGVLIDLSKLIAHGFQWIMAWGDKDRQSMIAKDYMGSDVDMMKKHGQLIGRSAAHMATGPGKELVQALFGGGSDWLVPGHAGTGSAFDFAGSVIRKSEQDTAGVMGHIKNSGIYKDTIGKSATADWIFDKTVGTQIEGLEQLKNLYAGDVGGDDDYHAKVADGYQKIADANRDLAKKKKNRMKPKPPSQEQVSTGAQ